MFLTRPWTGNENNRYKSYHLPWGAKLEQVCSPGRFFFFFFFLIAYFVIFSFFKNVLFMLQQPMEVKGNYLWKEVASCWESCAAEPQAYPVKGKKMPGPRYWWEPRGPPSPDPTMSAGLWWQEITCGVIFSCWERQMHPDQYHCPFSKRYCDLTEHF